MGGAGFQAVMRVKKQAGCLSCGAFVNLVYKTGQWLQRFLQTDSWNPRLHSAGVTPYTRLHAGSLLSWRGDWQHEQADAKELAKDPSFESSFHH